MSFIQLFKKSDLDQQGIKLIKAIRKFFCIALISIFAMLDTQAVNAVNPELPLFQNLRSWSNVMDWPGEINDFVIGADGFLWAATTDGLVRFDGEFNQIYQVATHINLQSNNVRSLYVDQTGQLIIATTRGISILDNESITPLLSFNDLAISVHQIIQMKNGELIFATDKGVFNLQGQVLTSMFKELEGRNILAFKYFDNALWIAGVGRLWSLRDDTLKEFALPGGLKNTAINVMEIHEKTLWLGTESGLWSKSGMDFVEQEGFPMDKSVSTLVSDRHGALWIAGLEIYARILPSGKLNIIRNGFDVYGFSVDMVKFVEDVHGNLWEATRNGVMGFSDVKGGSFRISATEGLSTVNIRALTVNKQGKPLVAQEDGVYLIEQARGIKESERVNKVIDTEKHPDINNINVLFSAANGDVWLGTDNGLFVFNEEYQRQTQIDLADKITQSVNSVIEDAQKNLLIGTTNGLYQIADSSVEEVKALRGRIIEVLFLSDDKRLWVGTDKGLYVKTDSGFMKMAQGLVPDYAVVASISSLPNGYIVASVRDRGLLIGKDDEWRLLTVEHGLTGADIFYTQMSPDGYLWAVSSKGLYRMKAPELIKAIDTKITPQFIVGFDEVHRAEIAEHCCSGNKYSNAILKQGMLYVSSMDGMIAMDVNNAIQDKPLPIPYIRAQSFDSIGNWHSVAERIQLSATQRSLRLKFSSVQLLDGTIVHYRYRLASNDWVYVGFDHIASFTNLAPGEQIFELQASVRENDWSPSTVLSVTREPGFVETSSFKTLVLFALIGLYALLIVLRARWLRRRSEHIESIIQEKTFSLREVNALLNQANANLKRVSHSDALTDLHNRHYLESNKHILAMDDAEINKKSAHTAIVIVDIDYFKRVNDSHGHVVGDRVLRQFALMLKNSLHVSDEVIRWGGEEFLLILHYAEGNLPAILKRLCHSIRDHEFNVGDGFGLKLTVSVGAITISTQSLRSYTNKFTNFFQCADLALYSVKRNGRDGWAYLELGDEQFQQVMLSAQLPDDVYQLLNTNAMTWNASRSEIAINSDNTIVELSLVRSKKENLT